MTSKMQAHPRTSLTRKHEIRELPKSEAAAAQLAQLIVNGELAVSSCLASENELSAHYEISRPNIRQALQRLAAAGLVETRHGVGTFVTASERWNLFDPLILNAFMQSNNLAAVAQELVELRVMVEVECAGLAAERISVGDLKNLELSLRRMEIATDDIERMTHTDLTFHNIIISASHNRFFQGIMSYLAEPLSRARFLTMQAGGHEGRERAQRAHRDIYNALAAQEVAGARAAMFAHMQQLGEDMRTALATF